MSFMSGNSIGWHENCFFLTKSELNYIHINIFTCGFFYFCLFLSNKTFYGFFYGTEHKTGSIIDIIFTACWYLVEKAERGSQKVPALRVPSSFGVQIHLSSVS